MVWKIIVALIILLLAVIFIVQNAQPVELKFLIFNFEATLSLILLLTLVIGVIVGLLLFLPTALKGKSGGKNNDSSK